MTKQTYSGSCTCGAVAFTCELDLAAGTTRCNCTFCRKARFWMTLVPVAAVAVTRGEDALIDYQRTPAGQPGPFLHLYFCRHCGIHPFSKGGVMPEFGGEFYAVYVACLDGGDDLDAALAAAPVRHLDGRHDDWASAPAHSFL
jgi:hypothetical protein